MPMPVGRSGSGGRSQSLEQPGEARVLPGDLEVRDRSLRHHQVEPVTRRPAVDLIRDVDAVGSQRVVRLWWHHPASEPLSDDRFKERHNHRLPRVAP